MYFGILKIQMDSETLNDLSYQHAVTICENIRSRFKVAAKPYQEKPSDIALSIIVAMLAKTQDKMNRECDEILNLIETKGLGRILNDVLLVDHIDSIED